MILVELIITIITAVTDKTKFFNINKISKYFIIALFDCLCQTTGNNATLVSFQGWNIPVKIKLWLHKTLTASASQLLQSNDFKVTQVTCTFK